MADEKEALAKALAEARADAQMFATTTFTLGKRVAQLEEFLHLGFESGPLPEPDYEALGYPESRVYLDDLDALLRWEHAYRAICYSTTGPELVPNVSGGLSFVMRMPATDKE
jgi:hypothetical protein